MGVNVSEEPKQDTDGCMAFVACVAAVIIGLVLFSKLDLNDFKSRPPPSKIAKKIVEKIQSVEQRLTIDVFDSNAIRGRATTVFYLVAEDGSTLEVDMKYYTHTDVGDSVESSQWKD